MATGLIPPSNLNIDFQPSSKQYEVWKCLQPECPICGGKIEHIENGKIETEMQHINQYVQMW